MLKIKKTGSKRNKRNTLLEKKEQAPKKTEKIPKEKPFTSFVVDLNDLNPDIQDQVLKSIGSPVKEASEIIEITEVKTEDYVPVGYEIGGLLRQKHDDQFEEPFPEHYWGNKK